MLAALFAPVAGLMFIAHKLLHGVLSLFCLFLFFSAVSGAREFVPDGLNGLIGIVGCACALMGSRINRPWISGKRPNYVKIIAMGWTLCFMLYLVAVAHQRGAAMVALISVAYMLIPFPVEEPEVPVTKKEEPAPKNPPEA